jgi:hypothetical protein
LTNPRPVDLIQRQNTSSFQRRTATRSASFFFSEAPTSSGQGPKHLQILKMFGNFRGDDKKSVQQRPPRPAQLLQNLKKFHLFAQHSDAFGSGNSNCGPHGSRCAVEHCGASTLSFCNEAEFFVMAGIIARRSIRLPASIILLPFRLNSRT